MQQKQHAQNLLTFQLQQDSLNFSQHGISNKGGFKFRHSKHINNILNQKYLGIDSMKQTYNHLNPVFILLGSNSTQTSPMSTTDLNDSIEYYIDQKEYQTELEIVRYLHNLGVQTKTDPQIKEQKYWKEKRQRSQNIILDTIGNSADKMVLNPSVNRLLRKNVSQKRLRSNSPIFLLD